MDKEKLNKPIDLSDTTRGTSFDALLSASMKDVEVPMDFTSSIMQRIEKENIQIERTAKVTSIFAKSGVWVRGIAAVAAAGIVFLGAQNVDFNPTVVPEVAEVPAEHELTEVIVNPPLIVAEIDPPELTVDEPIVKPPIQNPETDQPELTTEEPAVEELVTLPVERDVDPEDLTEEVRLDAVVSIASEKGRLPAGTLDLLPLYNGEQRAIAPSFTDNGDVLYFIETEEGLYDLVRQAVDETEYRLNIESVASNEINVHEAMVRSISKEDISISDDAVYYKEIQILPSLMDAELEYALAPNDIFVVVNAKSDNSAIEGLWVTDIYNANMGKLSIKGGGSILAWAPDSSSLLFTDRDGSIYLGDINDAKTYLVAERGDVGHTLANYSADGRSFVIACRVDDVDSVYYVQVP
jgi:hypothetical protein